MSWTTEGADASMAGQRGHPPSFDAREAAAQVAADMNAAFSNWVDMGAGSADPKLRRRRFGPSSTSASPRPGRLNLITAVSVGVLVGISVGALIARPPRGAPPSTAVANGDPQAQRIAAAVPDAPSTPPAYLHVETAPAPAFQAPPGRSAQAYPPIRTSPLVQAVPPGTRDPSGLAQDRYAGVWSGRRTVAWNTPRPMRAYPSDAPSGYWREGWAGRPSAASPAAAGGGPLCFGQAGERRRDCLIAASDAADAQLRASYRQAAMAGVSNPALEADTQSWNDLRWRGGSDPEQMIVGYRRLNATLRAQAAAARRERMAQAARYGMGPGYAPAAGDDDGSDRPYPPW